MEQFEQNIAAFLPQRTDDLREEMKPHIGSTYTWRASWIIEDGPYAGQWAMVAVPDEHVGVTALPVYWVPESDLKMAESSGGGHGD